jgi:hypothetical protein
MTKENVLNFLCDYNTDASIDGKDRSSTYGLQLANEMERAIAFM